MRQTVSAFLTVLLVLWGLWQLLQLPALAVQMSRAGHAFSSLVRALEDSYCDPEVAEECIREAAEAGYRLTVREVVSVSGGRLCRVEMAYTVRLWGGTGLWEEVLCAYAG